MPSGHGYGGRECCHPQCPAVCQDETTAHTDPKPQWSITTDVGIIKLNARLIALKQGFVQFEEVGKQKRSFPLSQLDPEDRQTALIDRVGSGVVMIATKNALGEPSGFGSGFVMNVTGLILTNYHVIAGAGSAEVIFRDHEQAVAADVLAVDRTHDIAVLRVQPISKDVHILELHSQQLPPTGSLVWAIGHPSGLKNTVGWGNINAVRMTSELPAEVQRVLKGPVEIRWLQTNAVLASGSSGGPLLNELGQVVGMNTFVLGPQIGFAITAPP